MEFYNNPNFTFECIKNDERERGKSGNLVFTKFTQPEKKTKHHKRF